MMKTWDKLYNLDSKGKMRVWFVEQESEKYRVVSGIVDGKLTTTKWKVAKAKNVGKVNETTPSGQASLEIQALYDRKIEQKYFGSQTEARENGSGTKFFQPMLAVKWRDVKDSIHEHVFLQPKLDGIRCESFPGQLLSRRGKPIESCPHVVESLRHFHERFPNVVLDGELYNHGLRDDFNKITSLVRKSRVTPEEAEETRRLIQFHVYDCLDRDDPEKRFSDRKRFLDEHVHFLESIVLVQTIGPIAPDADLVDQVYGSWLGEGYEGMMYRLDRPYESTRTNSLIKRKEFHDSEYPVSRISEGKGNWSGVAKSILCTLPDGTEFEAGMKGDMDHLRKVLDDYLSGARVPTHATIRYPNLTPAGKPRFGICVDLHYGKRED
jgi:ATP-dependent DNA ligase